VCDQIARESQRITVVLERKKFGKAYTVISGINEHELDTSELAKKLKNKLACGGTGKDGVVALQGNHLRTVKDALVGLGFPPDTIDIQGERRR
jgi:translation initiation factor 1